jgi:hypothetical protein
MVESQLLRKSLGLRRDPRLISRQTNTIKISPPAQKFGRGPEVLRSEPWACFFKIDSTGVDLRAVEFSKRVVGWYLTFLTTPSYARTIVRVPAAWSSSHRPTLEPSMRCLKLYNYTSRYTWASTNQILSVYFLVASSNISGAPILGFGIRPGCGIIVRGPPRSTACVKTISVYRFVGALY